MYKRQRWYTDGEGQRQTEPATRIYDVQQGITMAASEAQPFFTVTAIALDKDRNAPASSVSDAVSFVSVSYTHLDVYKRQFPPRLDVLEPPERSEV